MNYRYICPQTIFGIFMQNYKMFIGTRDAKHASGKYLTREAPLNSLTVDTSIQDKGRKIAKNSGNYYLQICFANDVIQIT